MNIQLTISLLVSDRPDTLKKCLNSILPLLKHLESELIIVYTGKGLDTLELAKQYTSHIIPFTWCSDFAKARNAGLREAKGEWFLYLDDDEWFEDTSDIIHFFQSGEYRRYESALYIQRNYQDREGMTSFDTSVGRMCRITPETRFIYPIHENLSPFPNPCKKLDVFVHHFGYVEQAEGKDLTEKTNRNIPLLLQRLETESDDIQCCMQLAQEYRNILQFNKAIEYCRKGLDSAAKEKRIFSQELWMQVNLPLFISAAGDQKQALEEGERILRSSRTLEVGEAHLHSILTGFCLELKEYGKGLEHVNTYHARMRYLKRHPEDASRQNGGTVTYESAKTRAISTYIAGLLFAAELNEPRQIREILTWIPWDNESEIALKYETLEKWKEDHPDHRETILQGFYGIKTDNTYVTLQKALYAEERQSIAEAEKLFSQCCNAAGSEKSVVCQLAGLAARNRFNISALLELISAETWDVCTKRLAERTEISEMPDFLAGIQTGMAEYPIYAERLEQRFLEKQLLQGGLDVSRILGLLRRYSDSTLAEAELLYNKEILQDPEHYALPFQYKFAFIIRKVLENLENKAYAGCIPLLKKALQIYPDMTVVIKKLTGYLEEEMSASGPAVSEEFTALGRQVKQVLYGLMENKQWQEAYGVADQLAALLPDDLEVLRLKQEILCKQ